MTLDQILGVGITQHSNIEDSLSTIVVVVVLTKT